MKAVLILSALLASCFVAQAAMTKEQYINDMNTLNYALALENFEADFYSVYLAKFPNAAAAGVNSTFYTYLQQSGIAEASHANTLKTVINAAGWLAAPACTYNYTRLGDSAATWLSTLAVVENLGASAYTYASQYLTFSGYLTFAASVATVEARHAAFLNALNQADPFPSALQGGASVADVFTAINANGFFASCPTVSGVCTLDGVNRTFGVLDHAPGKPYSPQLANTLRRNVTTGTNPLYTGGSAYNASAPKLSDAAFGQDTLVLQYALTAENLEAAFYNYALNQVTQTQFTTYFTDSINPLLGLNTSAGIYTLLSEIKAHENAHVTALNGILTARGTSGVPACSYPGNFAGAPVNFDGTASTLLPASLALENAGVGAYLGAITLLTDVNLVNLAASVALVEARHASYLQVLVRSAGLLPGATNAQTVDTASTPSEVASVIGPLLGTCGNITTADRVNGFYSSLTLPYGALTAKINSTLPGGYGDAAQYTFTPNTGTATGSTSTSSGTSNTGASSTTSASSAVIASVAVVLAAVALVF